MPDHERKIDSSQDIVEDGRRLLISSAAFKILWVSVNFWSHKHLLQPLQQKLALSWNYYVSEKLLFYGMHSPSDNWHKFPLNQHYMVSQDLVNILDVNRLQWRSL